MRALADLQTRMVEALLGRQPWPDDLVDETPVGALEGLGVYRGNAEAGAASALRATFPTVARLVGEAFFNGIARDYFRHDPPTGACLSGYGGGFPAFLRQHDRLAAFPYLEDAARFDAALDRIANAGARRDGRPLALDDAIQAVFDDSLEVFAADYAVDEIRNAIDSDEGALSSIDLTRSPRWRALWLGQDGVRLRPLSAAAAAFLAEALAGADLSSATAAALERGGAADAAAAIETEILQAPFTRIVSLRAAS